MKFLVDENLPRKLVGALTALGHSAWYCPDVLGRSVGDTAIWRCAIEREAIIVTKDDDFLALFSTEPLTVPLVWLRIGNCSRTEAIDLVIRHLDVIASSVAAGRLLVEL